MKTGSVSEMNQLLTKYHQSQLLSTSKQRTFHRELSCLKKPKSWNWADILFSDVSRDKGRDFPLVYFCPRTK